MKKIIIFILSGILLLVSGAKAEIIYMNCKFNEGWHQKGTKSETVKKSPDIALVWDKEKKVIKNQVTNSPPINNAKAIMGSQKIAKIIKAIIARPNQKAKAVRPKIKPPPPKRIIIIIISKKY